MGSCWHWGVACKCQLASRALIEHLSVIRINFSSFRSGMFLCWLPEFGSPSSLYTSLPPWMLECLKVLVISQFTPLLLVVSWSACCEATAIELCTSTRTLNLERCTACSQRSYHPSDDYVLRTYFSLQWWIGYGPGVGNAKP